MGDAQTGAGRYPVAVYVLPKHLDEKVARLQLVGEDADAPSDKQARYIGVELTGSYKPDLIVIDAFGNLPAPLAGRGLG